MMSFVERARDLMIHNVYCTRSFSPISSETQAPDWLFSVDTIESFSHSSASLSDASDYHVLLGDINIDHLQWGGICVRPDNSSQLLL